MAGAGASGTEPAVCWNQSDRALDTLTDDTDGIEIQPVYKGELQAWLSSQPASAAAWLGVARFKGEEGEVCLLPGADGACARVLLGLGPSTATAAGAEVGVAVGPPPLWPYAALPEKLPRGRYRLAPPAGAAAADAAALGWLLGNYKYRRYKTGKAGGAVAGAVGDASGDAAGGSASGGGGPTLQWPAGCRRQEVAAMAQAIYLCRDMVTTPAEDMGPQHIAQEVAAVAAACGASFSETVGDDLLSANYPAIHAVGRAAARPPRLLDMRWRPAAGDSSLPLVTLVGKGVAFDSGGLDIKSAAGMQQMKKDMGGSALVLALAFVIMKLQMQVQLRLLVPAVENAISGNAYRPLDVLQTRAGITVENGNTDAEGRLILCDALAEAASEQPDLIIDAATLTGAARAALGPEIPVLFANDDACADALLAAGNAEGDPLWRLPLAAQYRKLLDSKVADICSAPGGGMAGAITAALYLSEFVPQPTHWMHIDTSAWTMGPHTRPGRPEGGEAHGLRALKRFVEDGLASGLLGAL